MRWRGVDLDGTLAVYDEWRGTNHIGAPIPKMVERVRTWLAGGEEVRIVTARVSNPADAQLARQAIEEWCLEHIGQRLRVTNEKDYGMIELWDDRGVGVVPNTGERVDAWPRLDIEYLRGDDWVRLMVNGRIFDEGHSLHPRTFITLLEGLGASVEAPRGDFCKGCGSTWVADVEAGDNTRCESCA